MTSKEIKAKLEQEGLDYATSRKDGNGNPCKCFVAKYGYFYTHGMTSQKLVDKIKKLFPDVNIIDSGNEFNSWPKDSFFWVKFNFESPKTAIGSEPKELTKESLDAFINESLILEGSGQRFDNWLDKMRSNGYNFDPQEKEFKTAVKKISELQAPVIIDFNAGTTNGNIMTETGSFILTDELSLENAIKFCKKNNLKLKLNWNKIPGFKYFYKTIASIAGVGLAQALSKKLTLDFINNKIS